MSRLPQIQFNGVTTGGLQNISFMLPQGGLSIVCGPRASGKSALVVGTVYQESARQVAAVIGGGAAPPTSFACSFTSAAGILPPHFISNTSRERRGAVGEVLRIRQTMADLVAKTGVPTCALCKVEIAPIDSATRVIQLKASEYARVLVGAQARKTGRARMEIAKILQRGYRRFLTGDLLTKIEETGDADSLFGEEIVVIVDTPLSVDETRIQQSLETARTVFAGSPKAAVFLQSYRVRAKDAQGLRLALGERLHVAPAFECPSCGGRTEMTAVERRLGSLDLTALLACPVKELLDLLHTEAPAASPERSELIRCSQILCDTHLGHLALADSCAGLSHSEFFKLRVARLLIEEPAETNVIFDVPSRILHPTEQPLLLELCRRLCALGNTVLMAEEMPQLIAQADTVLELSAAGALEFVGSGVEWRERHGAPEQPLTCRAGEAAALSGAALDLLRVAVSPSAPSFTGKIPLRSVVCLTGPPSSKQSYLLREILARLKGKARLIGEVRGTEQVSRVVYYDFLGAYADSLRLIDLLGVGDAIAKIFAALPSARRQGFAAKMFSPVGPGGCPECAGEGWKKVDFEIGGSMREACNHCGGRRFSSALFEIRFGMHSIADIYEATVQQAAGIFSRQSSVVPLLRAASDFGVQHLVLGRQIGQLAESERQAAQLFGVLQPKRPPNALFLLDEPLVSVSDATIDAVFSRFRARPGESFVFTSTRRAVVDRADRIMEVVPDEDKSANNLVLNHLNSPLPW